MNSQPTLTRMGFVLTGGKSSRMGVDKAFLDFGGSTLLVRALAVVGAICPSVVIVGDTGKFAAFGTVVQDIYGGCGPLAGIHAALRSSSAELNLALAVDMPFVSPALLAFLFAAAKGSDAIVTVPRTAAGFQPLCAIYRRVFADTAESALQAGNYKIDALFPGVSLRVVDEKELGAAGFVEQSFYNVNTPEDLRTAKKEP